MARLARPPRPTIRRLLAAAALAAVLTPVDAAAAALVLDPAVDAYDASGAIEVYRDPSGTAGPDDVRGAPFRPLTGRAELGPRGGVLWLRLQLENRTPDPRTWMLHLDDPLIERIDVWLHAGGATLHRRGGVDLPVAQRSVELHGPWHQLPVLVLAEERIEVLVRVAASGPFLARVGVSEGAALDRAFLRRIAEEGALLGVLLALGLVNLYSFLALRDRSHLVFLGLTATFVAFVVSETGLGPAFVWPGAPGLAGRAPALFAGLALHLLLRFADAFLGTRPGPGGRALAWIPLAASAVALSSASAGNVAVTATVFFVVPFLSARTVRALTSAAPIGRFFAVAMAPLLVSTAAYYATRAGLVPVTYVALHGVHFTFPLTAFMVAFALADRVRSADTLARARLEQAVAERTAELATTIEALRREAEERRAAEEARRASEEQLRHAQRIEAIGRLAGGIAHDYNNVLTSVATNVGLLLMRPAAGDPDREILEDVREAADRGAVLTRQLLAFSRRQVLERQPLSANRVVEGLRRMLDRIVGENYELRLELAEGLRPIVADPGQLEQVIMNLVLNARDAMPGGGRIVISTAAVEVGDGPARGRYVRVSVADSGHGIPPEVLAHVFEPFFTTKPEGKGTGLGLATVHGIVTQHGGFVDVDPGPGRGAVFRVHLPVAEAGAATAGAAPERARRGLERGTETVLLVEDDAVVREATRRLLGELGYRVLPARDADDALRVCLRDGAPHPDLVFTDLVMPGVNGLELARQVQVRCPEARILLTSGHAHDVVAEQGAAGAGGLPFLAKPYSPAALAAKIRAVLDAPPRASLGSAP